MPKSQRRRSGPSFLALLAVPFVIVGVVASKVAHASHRRRAIAAEPETGPSYRVELGDTVSEIAISHGLPTAHVLAQNGLSWKTPIFPGQVIKLEPVPELTEGDQLLDADADEVSR